MNSDQLGGVIRALLAGLGGILVAKGYLSNADLQLISGAVVTLAVTGWSIYTNSTHQLIATTAAKPEVDKIITNTQATAAAIPATNVVAKP